MKALFIAGAQLRSAIRDRKALALMILLPMLLIGILGAALGPLINGDAAPIDVFPVAVYQGDPDGVGAILTDAVFSESDLFQLITLDSPDAVATAVQDGGADVGVIVPSGFSTSVFTGDPVQLEVIGNARRELQSDIVRSVVAAYADRMNALGAMPPGTDPAVIRSLLTAEAPPLVMAPVGLRPVSAYQYYAAGMAVMTLLFTAFARGRNFLLERQQWTLQRLLVTPTARATLIAGHFLAAVALVYGQFLVIVAGTRLIYGVSWGEPMWPALAVGFAYSVAAAGLAMLVAAFVGTPEAADQLGGIGVQLLAILGGSQVPIYLFPRLLRAVARWTPNGRTLQGFLDLMGGLSPSLTGLFAGLAGFGVVALALAATRLHAVREV